MTTKLRCAVIGAGWWSCYAHIPALKAHPRAELVAVQKRKADEAAKVAKDFAIPHACTTVEEVLALGVDAVVVGSTPNMHYAQTKAALLAGCHVLMEKPMTLGVDEARELVELAAAKGKQLLISCPWHYTSQGQAVRAAIAAGRLGRLRMLSVLMTNQVDHLILGTSTHVTHDAANKPYLEPRAGSYSDPTVCGGGQIYNQVSHAAAYLSYLTGEQPVSVFARFAGEGAGKDVYDVINIRMSGGTLVGLTSTGATMPSERNYEVRVYGDAGMALMELWKGSTVFHDRHGAVEALPPIPEADIYPAQGPAINLVDSALGLAPNHSPGTLGLAAMQVIDAACRSADSGRDEAVR